jgi:hypothetical protein
MGHHIFYLNSANYIPGIDGENGRLKPVSIHEEDDEKELNKIELVETE